MIESPLDPVALYHKLEKERAENNKLRRCIMYYAARSNWKQNSEEEVFNLLPECERDLGEYARQCLKEIEDWKDELNPDIIEEVLLKENCELREEIADLKQKLEASEAIADCFYEATKKVGW